MSADDEFNPYSRPSNMEAAKSVAGTRAPGPLAILFVVMASIVAAGARAGRRRHISLWSVHAAGLYVHGKIRTVNYRKDVIVLAGCTRQKRVVACSFSVRLRCRCRLFLLRSGRE